MSDLLIYLAVFTTMALMFGFGFLIGLANGQNAKKKKRKSKFTKCDCRDPNDCYKWCHAKELFTQDTKNGLV